MKLKIRKQQQNQTKQKKRRAEKKTEKIHFFKWCQPLGKKCHDTRLEEEKRSSSSKLKIGQRK